MMFSLPFTRLLALPHQWVLLCLVLGVFGLTACEAKKRVHGYVPRASEIATLKSGVFDKAAVVATIGSPGFINNFADNRWHYVSFKTSQVGFTKPDITEYKVLQLIFDSNNTLKSINLLTEDNLINVTFDEDFTPASGREMTVIQQIISNIGKFN